MITTFSPPRGEPGTVVRITGRHFDPTDGIRLAGRPLPVRGRGPNFIEVVAKGHSGPFVLVGRGGRRAVSASAFTVIRPPVVRGFRPRFGPPGTQITIFGHGFLPGDKAFIGPAMLTVRTVSDVQIVAELPAGVSDSRIYVKRGARAYYARGAFNVIHPPVVSSIEPPSGPPGTMVTIRGSHFMPGVSALLSGRRLQVVTRRLPHELRVRIPNNARSGRLVVVTRGGSASSPSAFVVKEYGALQSFFPLRGLPGTRVTLKGHGFYPGMKVWLGQREINPSQISKVTPTSAMVVVPEGYPSGRFAVQTWGRMSRSRMRFTVEQPKPELEFTFAPRVARRGSDVTLLLSPPRQRITVYFNGRPLPKRILHGGRRIIVTVPGDARSSGYFEIEYNGRRYRASRPLRVR